MQNVTQAWEETNRSHFTRPAKVTLSFTLNDGRVPLYSNSRIISFTFNKTGDPLSSILTQDTITFTLDNSDGRLNYDPETNDIYKNAFVMVWCSFMNEDYSAYDSIIGGKYYIAEVDMNASQKRIQFTAKSILAFMQAELDYTYNGNDTGHIQGTAYSVAQTILAMAAADDGVPASEINSVLDSGIMNTISVDFDSETDHYSMAQALQLIANACGCVLFVDRNGYIHIEPIGDVSENYIISGKICYDYPKLTYGEKIGRVRLEYDHGAGHAYTTRYAAKEGGTQIVTNPILDDDFDALERARAINEYFQTSRKKISGKFRADPRIDLFDIIVIPNGSKVSTCCVTSLNMTINGGWRGTYEAVEITTAILDLRIRDLEQLTIEQLESIRIENLHPNTVSDISGDYLACSDGSLVLWKGE